MRMRGGVEEGGRRPRQCSNCQFVVQLYRENKKKEKKVERREKL